MLEAREAIADLKKENKRLKKAVAPTDEKAHAQINTQAAKIAQDAKSIEELNTKLAKAHWANTYIANSLMYMQSHFPELAGVASPEAHTAAIKLYAETQASIRRAPVNPYAQPLFENLIPANTKQLLEELNKLIQLFPEEPIAREMYFLQLIKEIQDRRQQTMDVIAAQAQTAAPVSGDDPASPSALLAFTPANGTESGSTSDSSETTDATATTSDARVLQMLSAAPKSPSAPPAAAAAAAANAAQAAASPSDEDSWLFEWSPAQFATPKTAAAAAASASEVSADSSANSPSALLTLG